MSRILRPNRIAVRMGWARVAVRFANAPNPDEAIGTWARENQQKHLAGFPSRAGGTWTQNTAPDPSRLARELGLLTDEGLRTDLGEVLHQFDTAPWAVGAGPFHHSPAIRWILWFALMRADGGFWREGFTWWRPGQDDDQWIKATGERLRDAGDADLADMIAHLDYKRRREKQISPRLGALRDLDMEQALPRLHALASCVGSPWTPADILTLFQVGSQQPWSGSPTIEDLHSVLRSLPAQLCGIQGPDGDTEAPWAEVWVLAVAHGIAKGRLNDWREAYLKPETIGEPSLYLKSGGNADQPNLAWNAKGLSSHGAEAPTEPSSDPELPHHSPMGPPPSEAGTADPIELPVEQAASPPQAVVVNTPEPQPPQSHTDGGGTAIPPAPLPEASPDPREQNAAAWLQFVAWWAQGPNLSLLFVHGLQSRQLLFQILEHWTSPNERSRWAQRIAKFNFIGDSEQSIIAEELIRCKLPGDPQSLWDLCRESLAGTNKKLDLATVFAAIRRLKHANQTVIENCIPRIADWLRGNTRDTLGEVLRQTGVLLRHLLDCSLLQHLDLHRILKNQDPEDHVKAALAIVNELASAATTPTQPQSRLRARGQIGFNNPDVELPPDVWTYTLPVTPSVTVEFVAPQQEEEGSHYIRHVHWEMFVPGKRASQVRDTARILAKQALVEWLFSKSDLDYDDTQDWLISRQLVEVFDENNSSEELIESIHPQVSQDTGWGSWGRQGWFKTNRWPVPPEKLAYPIGLARSSTRPAHAISQLWSVLESSVGDAADGTRAIKALASAAADRVANAHTQNRQRLADLGASPLLTKAILGADPSVAATKQGDGPDMVKAASTTAWLLQATYAIRNRLQHESNPGTPEEHPRLTALYRSMDAIACDLLGARTQVDSWEDMSLSALLSKPSGKSKNNDD
jgi:hypothetical protein